MTAFTRIRLSVAALGLFAALMPIVADADWYPHSHDDVVVMSAPPPQPGLVFSLGDDEFSSRWNHSTYDERAHFCRATRHDCDAEGKHSRACYLKWKYCTPQGTDYGYYYNH